MENNKSHNVAAVAVAMLLIGGLVGFGVANVSNDKDMSRSTDAVTATSSGAELRSTLQASLTEHVDLAAPALKAAATGADDTQALLDALDANSVEIADAVDSVYSGTRDDFLGLWRDHIGFFADYTKAKVAGDEDGMKRALDDLAGYQDQASAFFAGANPNLDEQSLKKGLETHAAQVISIVDQFAAGDYEAALETQREASDHIAGFAATLAGAIEQQFPDKF